VLGPTLGVGGSRRVAPVRQGGDVAMWRWRWLVVTRRLGGVLVVFKLVVCIVLYLIVSMYK